MEDCYYEVFAMCQEGMLSVKYEKIEFDDGEPIYFCDSHNYNITTAIHQMLIEHPNLTIRIISFMICVLFCRGDVLPTPQVQVHPGNGAVGAKVSN